MTKGTSGIVDGEDQNNETVTNAHSENNLRDDKSLKVEAKTTEKASTETVGSSTSDWSSPSDALTGIVKLKPPFTSKTVRAKAHVGLLHIGDEILQAEYNGFYKQLKSLLDENDAAWREIIKHEQHKIRTKVKRWYGDVFKDKFEQMTKEMDFFYEDTLRELESYIRSETNQAITSLKITMVTDLNIQIKRKLLLEKRILKAALNKKFVNELGKIKRYYNLLLDNETDRCKELINSVSVQRNNAIRALYTQLNAENLTSCMYIMSTERKKCQVKKFFLESHLDIEIKEHLQKLADKENYLKDLKKDECTFNDLNSLWREKIQKILDLFTKFISFSLQLLPEQSNFLLDLEKLMILQLGEIIKMPYRVSPILVNAEQIENAFQFPSLEEPYSKPKKPFIIEGDTSEFVQKIYGSRETLPSDVELPFIVVDKDYIYAKCHKFEEIKDFIEYQYSKAESCTSRHSAQVEEEPKRIPSSLSSLLWSEPEQKHEMSTESIASTWTDLEEMQFAVTSSSFSSATTVKAHPPSPSSTSSSSPESQSNVARSETCPAKTCVEWIKRHSFPYLNTYLDYSDQNYARVQAIVTKKRISKEPKLIKPSEIARSKLPFIEKDVTTCDIATQYSSQADIINISEQVLCPCIQYTDNATCACNVGEPSSQLITEALTRRDQSIYNLMNAHPELINIFTNEKYDYKFLRL